MFNYRLNNGHASQLILWSGLAALTSYLVYSVLSEKDSANSDKKQSDLKVESMKTSVNQQLGCRDLLTEPSTSSFRAKNSLRMFGRFVERVIEGEAYQKENDQKNVEARGLIEDIRDFTSVTENIEKTIEQIDFLSEQSIDTIKRIDDQIRLKIDTIRWQSLQRPGASQQVTTLSATKPAEVSLQEFAYLQLQLTDLKKSLVQYTLPTLPGALRLKSMTSAQIKELRDRIRCMKTARNEVFEQCVQLSCGLLDLNIVETVQLQQLFEDTAPMTLTLKI